MGAIAFWMIFLLERLKFDELSKAFYITALGVSIIQFFTTTPYEFTSDIGGHIAYIQYVAENQGLPQPFGWQAHQPPLFYIISALFWDAGKWLGPSPIDFARVAAVMFYFGGMVFAGLLLRRFVKMGRIYYACLLVILFWPAAAHMSVKITNDIGQFFFACGFVYFLTEWLRENDMRQFVGAILFAAGGIASKSSAILLVFLLVSTAMFRLYRGQLTLQALCSRSVLVAFGVLLLSFTINFGRIYYWREVHQANVKWFVNRNESDYMETFENVGNKPVNYLSFRFNEFVYQPFMRFNKESPEANYFLNVLLKTLVFDDITYPNGYRLARALSFLFLVSICCCGVLMIINLRSVFEDQSLLLLLFTIVSAVAMSMCGRILIPISYMGSGRFIYIVYILFITALGHLLSRLSVADRAGDFQTLSLFSLRLFALLSILFTLSQWI
jgi:hypothetical protein